MNRRAIECHTSGADDQPGRPLEAPTQPGEWKEHPGMSDWEKTIGAITLFVEDSDHAKAFYQKVFELQPAYEDETDVMFRLANTLLFLTKSSEAPRMIAPAVVGSPGNGPRHVFAIIVDDVDA